MKSLYDEDGIDGPFDREIKRLIRMDRKAGEMAKTKQAKRKPAGPPPGPPEHVKRAPTGGDRVPTQFRLRRDLRDWLWARAQANGRTAAAELELILEDERKREARRG